MANNNKLFGQFNLVRIHSITWGISQIEVCFNIDANSLLNISSKDKGTSKS